MRTFHRKGLRKIFENNASYSDLLFLNCKVLIHQKHLGILVASQEVERLF